MMQLSLDSKIAVVTGAETETGAAIAAELARRGAAVAVQYLSSFPRAKQLVRDIEQAGGQAVAIKADLRDPQQTRLLCMKAAGAFGDIDVVVAVEPADTTSGTPGADPVAELAEGVRARLVTGLGPMYAALPDMVGRGTGALVYVAASALPESAEPDLVQSVSRAALREAMSRLETEFGPFGVSMHALPASSAQQVAHDVALLAADAVNGATV
ncbi:SDR family NAD(P)-dependent oxidoreductase [Kitasatospora sp. NBC_01250]|uniref:SDR family NAD(P)-dependent oxidoreductase n=1 Tax=Kitasatospora sp. NBC_01250 TaxID=2903571 RepID=UPI002E30B51C|nr:SDR family NAD(P)-dependent oxidoreductase [Kitasatospora sp. NBC_01250]